MKVKRLNDCGSSLFCNNPLNYSINYLDKLKMME
jgi:hypothetical protein